MKLKLFSDFAEGFRREPLSYVVFYLIMAILMIPLSLSDSGDGRVALIFAVCFGLFSAIYVSFSVQRFDIDRSELSKRGRLGYLVSALAFLLPYVRLGFPDTFPGPIWAYVGIFALLFLIAAPVVAAKQSSEQGGDLKPDHASS